MARTKDREKPAQIIEAAFEVFGDVGYEATVIKDIADRAGIAPGTIYTYFEDKKDLFRATAQEGWGRFLREMRALVESDAPVETRLRELIDTGFLNLKRYLPLLRGMLFESSQMNILQESLQTFLGLVEKLLASRSARRSPPVDTRHRRLMVKVTVIGVLFTAAMADPAAVDAEIDRLKAGISAMVFGG
ncbi:MAG TPA: TetR/AcrR family transcriptional regulator [Spirochaetia bacterium]